MPHSDRLPASEPPSNGGLRLAVAGGGTGGHIRPGLRLVERLARDGQLGGLTWLAGDRRVDRRLLDELDERLAPIPVRVLSLGLEGDRDAAPGRVGQLLRQPRAIARARAALVAGGAELLVGCGGYISLPAALAARSLGIPLVLIEVNAVLGGATRLLAPGAARVLHAFEGSLPPGRRDDERQRVTGPLVEPATEDPRDPRAAVERRLAVERLRRTQGLDAERPLLLVLGGSQGARALNRFVAEHLDRLQTEGVQVLHQVGPGRAAEAAPARPGYAAVEFLDPVEPALDAADLVLSRAGAATLAELVAHALPSVLVPYPHAAGRHQEHNAAQLADGTIVVPEDQLDAERAVGIARLAGPAGAERRARMTAELRRRFPGDGAARAAAACLEVLGRDPASGPARAPGAPAPVPAARRRDEARDVGPEVDGAALPVSLPERVHLLGVGGAGQSGLARLLLARGGRPSGHDRDESPRLDALRSLGLSIGAGPSAPRDLPLDAEAVVRSAAVPLDDPQVRAAELRGLPVLKYAEALGRLTPVARTLAVAGTHGKTSTSWLTLHALRAARAEAPAAERPGGLIGGTDLELGTNALPPGRDGWFVVEACEYDRSFLQLAPRIAIVTNVEADHLDCFGDLDGVVAAFEEFVARVDPEGCVLLGAEVPEAVERASRARVLRLGRELGLAVRGAARGRYRFDLSGPGWTARDVALAVPGRIQVQNAALALAATLEAAGPGQSGAAARGLGAYRGAGRRFESWLAHERVDVVHDYAHHPTELRVTLEAAREAFEGRPVQVLFQPHQFERTARFLDEFAASLEGVERVVVAEVYGARRADAGGPSADAAELVARLVARGVDAHVGGTLEHSLEALVEGLELPATVLVVGAGDVETIRDDLVRRVALRCGSPR